MNRHRIATANIKVELEAGSTANFGFGLSMLKLLLPTEIQFLWAYHTGPIPDHQRRSFILFSELFREHVAQA